MVSVAAVRVVAGIIWNADNTQLLISKRLQHVHAGGLWEFPGGKLENDESHEIALRRELKEELGIDFFKSENFDSVLFEYPEKQVHITFLEVYGVTGKVVANEGQEWRWVSLQDLSQHQFPDANIQVVDKLLKKISVV